MLWRTGLAHLLFGNCPRCEVVSRVGLCASCRQKQPLSRVTPLGIPYFALGIYEGMLAEKIRRLKYHDETLLAAHLGGALAQASPPDTLSCSLVPVPLHPLRLVERGYNQSSLLAGAIGRQLRIKVIHHLLFRTAHGTQQAGSSAALRQANVASAFRAGSEAIPQADAAGRLLLVDDVITTGSTIDACALALRSSGWNVVGALCCAIPAAPSLHPDGSDLDCHPK